MEKVNVYKLVTDRIIEELEKGIIPWQKPWTGVGIADGGAINYVTRKPYSMLNQMLLGREGEYLTFKQIKDLKGNIRKGATSSIVVFYAMVTQRSRNAKNEDGNSVKDENGNNVKEVVTSQHLIPILKYYRVFHIDDCEGIESRIKAGENTKNDTKPIEAAENVINGYLDREKKLKFVNTTPSNKAYYSPSFDKVVVPMLSQFDVPEEYYSTTFHELTHSTMPPYRCDRKAENNAAFFGSEDYSREELVAELGSAMICNAIGIDCDKAFKNSVAYIQSWLKVLKNDNKMIVWAASRAEKAAKYILDMQ